LDPRQRRRCTLDGVRQVLLRESCVQLLLLIFEDLHWIDGETQALLDSLIDSLSAARVLVMVSYRPEYSHSWGDKSYYRQVSLDPLYAEALRLRAEARSLARSLGDRSIEVVATIVLGITHVLRGDYRRLLSPAACVRLSPIAT